MTITIMTVSFSILNALRGSHVIQRIICAGLMGVVAWCFTVVTIGYIVWIGMLIGLSFGWGKYFAVFTGNMDTIKESEVKPIDRIVNYIYGIPSNIRQLKIWSFIAMTIRGGLFYPLFVGLSFYNVNALLYGIGVFSMGLVYWLMNFAPEKYAVRTAKCLYGAILGGLVGISVV